jgi:NADP-dependent 3-hydroxy acid dehydrogenase YdfG/acyl dehydratase/acyl carrier protein
MMTVRKFSDFQVGETAVFEQTFTPEMFEGFAQLSGDRNPLHHDVKYAQQSEFERPIVPMHMTIAPLSRIAGMIFPGDPSLYIGHAIRSILPVFYGETLTYSACIMAVNPNVRTLSIRVLICRGADVVVDANMRVMSRMEEWEPSTELPDLRPSSPVALVTGATGEIGTALARMLARRGWNLLLVDRGPGAKRDARAAALKTSASQDVHIEHVSADLLRSEDVDALCNTLTSQNNVTAVFHTASPPVDGMLNDLVQVNYRALQQIAEAVLPAMLIRQSGVVATIGTVATERVIPGWHDYSAAKAMAGQFLSAFDKSHSEFGPRGLTILSGLVATQYSESVQGKSPAMLPQELAESVLEIALDDKRGDAVLVEWNGHQSGKLGFQAARAGAAVSAAVPQNAPTVSPVSAPVSALAENDVEPRIAEVVRQQLRLPVNADLEGAGVGTTPGWDSLRHIELILGLEAAFGIRFGAGDVEKMLTYDVLLSTTRSYIQSLTS